MKLQVKIKTIGEERKGVSSRTGDDWRGRCLLLGWQENREDGNVMTHYQRAMVFDRQLEKFEQEFQPGDDALVDVSFSSTDTRSGYYRNEVHIMNIQKMSDSETGKGVAL